MIRLSACIEMIMSDLPIEERLERIGGAGLPAVEFWGWKSKDIDVIDSTARKHKLSIATFAVEPRGCLTDPGKKGEFLKGLEETIPVADRLGTDTLLTTSGGELEGIPRDEQHASIVETLRAAGAVVRRSGMVLHAGHGLTYRNVKPVAAIEGMHELNIGHSIVARAIMVGFQQAVREMKQLLS